MKTLARPDCKLRPQSTVDHMAEPDMHLTGRQRDVLRLLCEGLPNKLISRRLDISCGTVKVHVSSVFRALGVSSRLQAAMVAQRLGLLEVAAVAPSPSQSAGQPAQVLGLARHHAMTMSTESTRNNRASLAA